MINPVPHTFSGESGFVPASQLDDDFAFVNTIVTPAQQGADITGAADCSAAITAAAAFGTTIVFTKGTYLVGTNLSISVPVIMLGGAKISVATGKTVTFNAGFQAPIEQVFSNALASQGTIAFNPAFLMLGYPEWWGAQTGNSAVDCTP